MRASRIVLPLMAAVWIAAAASPAAADRWVSKLAPPGNTSCTQPDPCDTVTKALAAAGQEETINVGPGTYAETVFDNKRSLIVGAGAGSPDAPAGVTETVFTDTVALPDTRGIAKVRVENAHGIAVGSASAIRDRTITVADVVVKGQDLGLNALDQTLGGKMTVVVERSTFIETGPGTAFDFVTGIGANGGGDPVALTLRDSRVTSTQKYAVTTDGGPLTLDGTTVEATTANTLFAVGTSGGPTTIVRSRISGGRTGVFVDGGPLTVRDSVVRVRLDSGVGAAYGIFAGNSQPTPTTVVGSTIDVAGAKAINSIWASPSLGITNSVVLLRETAAPAGLFVPSPGPGTPGPLTISHTAVKLVDVGDGPEAPQAGAGNITGDPLLVDPAGGDLRPAAGSPLVDAGDPSVLTAGELDLAGAARALDGNGDCTALPDIGAYERPAVANPACAPPPPPAPGPAPAAPAAPDTSSPPVTGAAVKPAAGSGPTAATLTFTLGEPADVTVTLEGTGKAGAAAVRWRTLGTILKKRLRAGRQTVKVPRKLKGKRLRRGSYRLRVKATDAAGNTTTKLIAFKLRR